MNGPAYDVPTSPQPHPVSVLSLDATGQECAPTRTPRYVTGSALHCACGQPKVDGTCQSCTAPLNAVPRKRDCNGTVLPTNRTHLVITHLGTQPTLVTTDRARARSLPRRARPSPPGRAATCLDLTNHAWTHLDKPAAHRPALPRRAAPNPAEPSPAAHCPALPAAGVPGPASPRRDVPHLTCRATPSRATTCRTVPSHACPARPCLARPNRAPPRLPSHTGTGPAMPCYAPTRLPNLAWPRLDRPHQAEPRHNKNRSGGVVVQ